MPVARFKYLGANTYLGGEKICGQKIWGALLPNSPRGQRPACSAALQSPSTHFTHTFTKLVFTRQHHTKTIFTGAVPVNNSRDEENIERSQTLCLY